MIEATVQIDQPLSAGGRTVGTGFLISSAAADGTPQTVLVTANHVFSGMPGQKANIGYRSANDDGTWRYAPASLEIRDSAGGPLWTRHPTRDVAAITVKAPDAFARSAIPLTYLAADPTPSAEGLRPGDELMVLGFPRGLSANPAGFPILRAGRVASYPLTPQSYPTFLLDFAVFPGNSGGPVFVIADARQMEAGNARPMIAGLLTQQVELDKERMEIGIVTHARYIAETITLMGDPTAPIRVAKPEAEVRGATPVSSRPQATGFQQAIRDLLQRVSALGDAALRPCRNLLQQIGAALPFARA